MFWKNLMKTYFINTHRVEVVGIPSIDVLQQQIAEEGITIRERRELLGEEGLKQKVVELLNASKECQVYV